MFVSANAKKSEGQETGLEIGMDANGSIVVKDVTSESIFQGTGLKPGLEIVSINKKSTKNKSVDTIRELISSIDGSIQIAAKAKTNSKKATTSSRSSEERNGVNSLEALMIVEFGRSIKKLKKILGESYLAQPRLSQAVQEAIKRKVELDALYRFPVFHPPTTPPEGIKSYTMPPLKDWVKPGENLPPELGETKPSFIPRDYNNPRKYPTILHEYVHSQLGFFHLSTFEAHFLLYARVMLLRDADTGGTGSIGPGIPAVQSFSMYSRGMKKDLLSNKLDLVSKIMLGRIHMTQPAGRDGKISPTRKGYYTDDGGWIVPPGFRVDLKPYKGEFDVYKGLPRGGLPSAGDVEWGVETMAEIIGSL